MNSSDSFYSDERSIFNAIRVTTPNEDTHSNDSPPTPLLERGLATNMAMFIPPGSSHDGDSTQPRQQGRKRPGLDRIAWRNQLLSDQSAQRTQPEQNTSPFNDTEPFPTMNPQHRKAVSLDAAVGSSAITSHSRPRWPANQTPAAVSPNHPQYPPPERSPTPPGLPSFNTPEAIEYSAQFMVGHTGANNPATSTTRAASYSGAIRRFFGLGSATETNTNNDHVGIGRAPDGTIVQGRFPFRQSGHGTNQNRDINDHPFHQRSLPTAARSTAATATGQGSGSGTQGGNASGTQSAAGGRRVTEGATKTQQSLSRRRTTHTGLSLLGRPLSSLIEERNPTESVQALAAYSRTEPTQASRPCPREEISPLQLPEPRYDFALRAAMRRAELEAALEAGCWTFRDIICWVPVRCCSFCCLGPVEESPEDPVSGPGPDEGPDALVVVASRETYETARSENEGHEGIEAVLTGYLSPNHLSPILGGGRDPLP